MPLCAMRKPDRVRTCGTSVQEYPKGARATTVPLSNKCVLIVDDDPGSRMALYDTLEVRGYQCELAEHGAAAAVRIKTGHVDLVVTDHQIGRAHV